MREFYMFLCDGCGFSREKPGVCPYCQVPLTTYSKESQREYQVNFEEGMRPVSELQWYL